MFDAKYFKIISADNEISVEKTAYGGRKTAVTVSDEKVPANQYRVCIYHFGLISYHNQIVYLLQIHSGIDFEKCNSVKVYTFLKKEIRCL